MHDLNEKIYNVLVVYRTSELSTRHVSSMLKYIYDLKKMNGLRKHKSVNVPMYGYPYLSISVLNADKRNIKRYFETHKYDYIFVASYDVESLKILSDLFGDTDKVVQYHFFNDAPRSKYITSFGKRECRLFEYIDAYVLDKNMPKRERTMINATTGKVINVCIDDYSYMRMLGVAREKEKFIAIKDERDGDVKRCEYFESLILKEQYRIESYRDEIKKCEKNIVSYKEKISKIKTKDKSS